MARGPKIAVLTSGGIDSAVLIGCLVRSFRSVQPLYVKSGHIWERAELFWVRRFLKAVRSRRLEPLICLACTARDLYRDHWSLTGKRIPGARSHDQETYLPGKNILLIAKAAVYCAQKKIPALALAPLKSNPFPDATPRFFKRIAQAASTGLNYKIAIQTPFLSRSKRQVIRSGRHLPLDLTFSCLSPRGFKHCGRCNKCAERRKAFREAGIYDRTRYAGR